MATQAVKNVMTVDELLDTVEQFWQEQAVKRGLTKLRVDPYEIAAGFFKPKLAKQMLADDIDWSYEKYQGQEIGSYQALILELDKAEVTFTLKLVKRDFVVAQWQKPKYYQPIDLKLQNIIKEEVLATKTTSFNGTPDEVFAAYRGKMPVYFTA